VIISSGSVQSLDPSARLMTISQRCAHCRERSDAPAHALGAFFFSDDVSNASACFRRRAQPVRDARMLLHAAEFSSAHEPTIHLDLQAKTYCSKRCRIYRTVVFVSHDRYFIDKLPRVVFQSRWGLTTIPAITKTFCGKRSAANPGALFP